MEVRLLGRHTVRMHLVGAISKMHQFICEKGAIFTLCSENKAVLAAGSKGLSVVMETTDGEGGEWGRGIDLLSALFV